MKNFARINFRAPATKLQKFGTNFRAISARKCAKISTNKVTNTLIEAREVKCYFDVFWPTISTNKMPISNFEKITAVISTCLDGSTKSKISENSSKIFPLSPG